MRHFLRLLGLSIGLWSVACTTLSTPRERTQLAADLAAGKHWRGELIAAGQFRLMTYLPVAPASAARLTIYIEGDGFAWVTMSQPSLDPTPRDPLALRLALAQPDGTAAYLGRPCQYVDAENTPCSFRYWTNARFAPEVIEATDVAIESLKRRFSASLLTLVGYSGGAAVAALVAARRDDVDQLITVAGNLNPPAWAAAHKVSPLLGSLNPADVVPALQDVKQWHLGGARDGIVTPGMIAAFAALFPADSRPTVIIEPTFDHRCCWVEQWPLWWRNTFGTNARNEQR